MKDVTKNGGIDQPEKMTRLKWLNSTMAQENTVIAPYTPLEVKDTEISLLGRKLLLNKDGFPAQIQTFFTPEMTSIGTKANDILTAPATFSFFGCMQEKKSYNGKIQVLNSLKKEAGTVAWESTSTSTSVANGCKWLFRI